MAFSREAVAQAYQEAVSVARERLFEGARGLPLSLTDSVHTPYVGWVGKNYRGGTVFVAKNPGGGGDSQAEPTPLDLEVQRTLLALRDDSQTVAADLLDRVTQTGSGIRGDFRGQRKLRTNKIRWKDCFEHSADSRE